jgi:putative ATP-binding cassette transporter
MTLIKFLLQSSWKMMLAAILTGFLSGASSAGLIALMSYSLNQQGNPSLLWGFTVLALVTLASSWWVRVLLIQLSQQAVFQLQMSLSRQILAAELGYLERLGAANLLAALTEDVQAIANAVYVLPFIFINLAIVSSCLVYITWLSWQVLGVILLLAGLAVVSSGVMLKKGRNLLSLAREDQGELFGNLRTLTEGVKELKLYYDKRQDFLQEDLQVTATKLRQHNVQGLSLLALTDSSGKLIFFMAIALVLFVLPRWMELDTLTLSSYVITFTFIVGPLDNLVSKLPILSKADVSLQKLRTLGLSLADHSEMITVPEPISPHWNSLELKQVTHIYQKDSEDKPFTLGPVNLTFYPGELVFLIGGNGSGKSTLAKILTGLYSPNSGEIYLDRQLITNENREWYRQHFSVIFADFYLFDRLLGVDYSQLEKEAKGYLKSLGLEKKLSIQDGNFSTTFLSQGQRRRLALLTAYLEDRPIYLFDEWAADQDPLFKELFYTQILPQLKDRKKLVLVISHDDHYFHLGDRQIKLDSGQIEYDRVL